MIFTKGDLQNWDERATDLSSRGMNHEANELLMHVYNNMTFCNKPLSELELYRLFLGLGATSYAINENKKAIYFFDRIISMSDEYDKNNDVNVSSAVVGKVAILKSQKKYKEAFELIDSFSRNYNRQFVIEEYPNIYVELAYGAKQYDKGISFGIEAIDVAKRKKTYVSETTIYMFAYLVACFEELRKWSFASDVAEERLRLIEILHYEGTHDWVDCITDCVRCHCYRKQYKKAKEFIDKLDSVELDKDSEDEEVQMQFVRYVYWKGYIYQNLGDYKQAEIFYELCAKEVEDKFSKYPLLKSKLNKQRKKLLCQKTSLKEYKKVNKGSLL